MTLNWRLFWRSLRQSDGGAWVVVAAALLTATAMGESSVRWGQALASNEVPRSQASLLLGLWAWSTFAAAFAYAMAAGELSFIRSLLADLAYRPVSRWQAFVAAQAAATAGPHTCAMVSVGLPWLILLATWLDGTALLGAILATFVVMRLAAALLSIGARVVNVSRAPATTAAGVLLAALALLWLTAPDLPGAWSPPALLVRIALDDGELAAWGALAAWTLAFAAIEFWSMRLEAAPRGAPVTAARGLHALSPITAWLARVAGCPAVLLDGELTRLRRWRRYQLSWLMCAVLLLMVGSRLGAQPGLVLLLLFSFVPIYVGTSVLANLFGADRGGFHAFLMAPTSMRAVLRSKVVAVLVFTLCAQAAVTAYLLAHGVAWGSRRRGGACGGRPVHVVVGPGPADERALPNRVRSAHRRRRPRERAGICRGRHRRQPLRRPGGLPGVRGRRGPLVLALGRGSGRGPCDCRRPCPVGGGAPLGSFDRSQA